MNEAFLRKIIPLNPWKEGKELLDHEDLIFWVDWRASAPEIVQDCEALLQTGELSVKVVNTEVDPGYEIFITFGDRRVQVPLTGDEGDLHLTLLTLNEVLQGHFDVRFCIASDGSDTLAFLPLPESSWLKLEHEFGEQLGKHFYKIQASPNLFTDPLPFARMQQEAMSKPWWKFW